MQNLPIKTHMPSVAQFFISLTGMVTSFGAIIALVIVSVIGPSTQSPLGNVEDSLTGLMFCLIVYRAISIPSFILAVRRLARLPVKTSNPRNLFLWASLLLAFVLVAFILVNLIFPDFKNTPFRVVFTILCTLAPLWWFVELGRYKLVQGNPQRFWGFINFGIFAGMPVILIVEMGVLLIVILFGGIWFFSQPEFKSIWMTVQTQLMLDPAQLNNTLIQQLLPVIQKPGVLVVVFILISLIIPLIEEMLKPLALWFFMKRNWSPAEGFSVGLLCGATFGLVESLNAVVQLPSDQWISGLVARMGTGLLHTFATGVIGWALTSSWKDGKYLRLGLAYLFSVCLHGIWNFFALFSEIGTTSSITTGLQSPIPPEVAVWVLGSLSLAILTLLGLMNVLLRRSAVPPPISPLAVGAIE